MMKRLIEVALPLKEVSEQSAREKSIRHGHISTLHIWWARRPLAACRAVVFASLIPDPDDPACPESFRSLVMETLGRSEFRPKALEPSPAAPPTDEPIPLEDTPRNRCLEFIKYLVRWENSNAAEYIEPARTLIAAAHKILHPEAEGDSPKVIDPFSGGGAIPLEALRLGCDTTALDLNPVAHLIELCTLVYPQKYGQPDSRPVPEYIKRGVGTRKPRKGKSEPGLFDREQAEPTSSDGLAVEVEISEADYRRNPLAADVKFWGHWILGRAREEIGRFYPPEEDGSIPVAYLWARTVKSPDPTVNAMIPLVKQLWVCRSNRRDVALKLIPNQQKGRCEFEVVEGEAIDFDPEEGTMRRGDARCPFTGTTVPVEYLRSEARAGRMGHQLICVVSVKKNQDGKIYRAATEADTKAFLKAKETLARSRESAGGHIVPNEPLPPVGTLGFRVNNYGLTKWVDLFNDRQALALTTFVRLVGEAIEQIAQHYDPDYSKAIGSYLGLAVGRYSDFNSSLCIFNFTGGRGVKNTFSRQALPMVWDYAESAPFNPQGANWQASIGAAVDTIGKLHLPLPARVLRASATGVPIPDSSLAAVVTDPPYYDAVPYADLSDFFYVWLKRAVGDLHPDVFRTPLTPKSQELISYGSSGRGKGEKSPQWYESGMAQAFKEMHRTLGIDGVAAVMFAHKETSAWETLITGLIRSGLLVTGSWPFHTERPGRMRAQGSAALASSVTLVCRKRDAQAGDGLWDEVRQQLQTVARERLDFFWSQGIRGADFFISAIGPALSVFGRFDRVTRLSGEEVTVGQFLDEVRGIVSNYALSKILKTSHTSDIDPESRFYVVWKWSYADAKVPADEAFKLAQALGMSTDLMWDRTGVLEKAGENVAAVTVEKRKKINDLGEPGPSGVPASLIDVLHRLCAHREKNDTNGMAEFLARSGQAQNPSLWLVAQAVSEILPDGDKEKQLMQGLLNQKDQLHEAQGRLF